MSLEGLDPATALIVAAIFVFGGVVKGATGFGLPLTTIAFLPLIVPFDLALALNTLVVPATNVAMIWAMREPLGDLRASLPVIAGIAATVFVAASAVSALGPEALGAAMGALLLGFALFSFAAPSFRVPPRHALPLGVAVGMTGGVVGAAFTAPGPIYAAYLAGLHLPRPRFVGRLGVTMTASGLLVSGAFWASGILDLPRGLASLACAAPAFLGMWAGDRLARRLAPETFRRLVLLMLAGLGLNYLWKAMA